MAFLSFGTYEALRIVLDRALEDDDDALGVGAIGEHGTGNGNGRGGVVAQVAAVSAGVADNR
jgi:hypothetical protein